MRLNKYIAACGITSRRKAEKLIREGRIKVNGKVDTDLAVTVKPYVDLVEFDGQSIAPPLEKRYYVLNKPEGYITTHHDTHGRATVFDLLGAETEGVFQVGRLDRDTSGVLLLTDDGDLANMLMHPSYGVEKVYRAKVKGRITQREKKWVWAGVELEEGVTAPSQLEIIESEDQQSVVFLILHQGWKRQVRRMFDVMGHPVTKLERVSFGGITANGLAQGQYRLLAESEVASLWNKVQSKEE